MAQINKPTDYFNTKLYAGNSGTQSISGINFQPDFLWIKRRTIAGDHNLVDIIRTSDKTLISNDTGAEYSNATITSFDSDGFSLSGSDGALNASGSNYVAWNWLASNTTASNTDGSITSTVSANTTSGFSIVSYTGTGANATIGHGLGSAPKMIMVKQLSSPAERWFVYHEATGNGGSLFLNTTSAYTAQANNWNSTSPTSTVFSVGVQSAINSTGNNYIAYCFAEKTGYSKFGSFVGTGSQQFIYLGFKPRWFLWKNTSQGDATYDHWGMVDTARQTPNGATDGYMRANQNNGEGSFSGNGLFFLSNGIQFNNTGRYNNNSGDTYIYMAFAESPLVGTNNIPATAR